MAISLSRWQFHEVPVKDTRAWFAPGLSWGASQVCEWSPGVAGGAPGTGDPQWHSSACMSCSFTCLSPLNHFIRAGLSLTGMDNLNEPFPQPELLWDLPAAASWNSRQCSAHQENCTSLILPQIQFKVKCSTDCNYMCISPYFHLIGRGGMLDQGTCHLESPQGRLWLALLHSWGNQLSVASQHSSKEIMPAQLIVLFERRIMNTWKKEPFITNNYFPQVITFILTLT